MKILWAIPAYRHEVHSRIIAQMMGMVQTAPGWVETLDFTAAHSPDVASLHNRFTEQALNGGYGLMVIQGADSWVDRTQPTWDMIEFARDNSPCIVGAAVMCKGDVFNVQRYNAHATEPYIVDRIGSGFTVYTPEGFKESTSPPFLVKNTAGIHVGCDYAACDVAKELGMKIYCDPRVNVWHRTAVLYASSVKQGMKEPC